MLLKVFQYINLVFIS